MFWCLCLAQLVEWILEAEAAPLQGTVLLLVTNDTHSMMHPRPETGLGGAGRRATYFKGRAHEEPLILDDGDVFQG